MKIENLAQLKKYLDVGVKLRIKYAQPDQYARKTTNGMVRAIKKKQSNAIQFENESWLFWEKASRYSFFEGGFSVYWDDEKKNKIMDYFYE